MQPCPRRLPNEFQSRQTWRMIREKLITGRRDSADLWRPVTRVTDYAGEMVASRGCGLKLGGMKKQRRQGAKENTGMEGESEICGGKSTGTEEISLSARVTNAAHRSRWM